jgi:hypothetical protein
MEHDNNHFIIASRAYSLQEVKREKLMESRGQYISSAKYYLQQNRGTHTIKNLHAVYSQQHESYGNISRCIQS